MIALLSAPESGVRVKAMNALALVDPSENVVLHIAERLHDEDWDVRIAAARILGKLGPKAEAAIPQLIRTIQSPEHQSIDLDRIVVGLVFAPIPASIRLRESAAWALGGIGPSAEAALPALEDAVNDDNELVSTAAQEAMALIRGTMPPSERSPCPNTFSPRMEAVVEGVVAFATGGLSPGFGAGMGEGLLVAVVLFWGPILLIPMIGILIMIISCGFELQSNTGKAVRVRIGKALASSGHILATITLAAATWLLVDPNNVEVLLPIAILTLVGLTALGIVSAMILVWLVFKRESM